MSGDVHHHGADFHHHGYGDSDSSKIYAILAELAGLS
jgi:hypothetical protein